MLGHMRATTDITIGGFERKGEFAAIDLRRRAGTPSLGDDAN